MPGESFGLLGAELGPTRLRRLAAGRLGFGYAEGGVRYLALDGQEVLRAIAFVVRDADWGTVPVALRNERVVEEADRISVSYRAEAGGALAYEARIEADAEGLVFRVDGEALKAFTTCRTGFTLLHPLQGFADTEVEIRHSDCALERLRMPEEVSPGQPAFDIRGLAYGLPSGGRAEIAIDADQPFEMEDQRNWTDASFKTYFRPLALPFPYTLEARARFAQTVRVRVAGGPARAKEVRTAAQPARLAVGAAPWAALPEIGLAWFPGDPAPSADERALLAPLAVDRLALRLDLTTSSTGDAAARVEEAVALAEALGARLDLRVVLPDSGEADAEAVLAPLARQLAGRVASVLALPAAFLKSHQPSGPWPEGPRTETAVALARRLFPGAEVVEGMLTYFTELNRHRPRAGADAVEFSTAAVMHAADDVSVMETLEALPSVFRTARAIAEPLPVDVGSATLGMWANPYGSALTRNPGWERKTTTDRDPRQRGLFAAAWTLGYLAQATAHGIRSVGLGAVSGPLGLLPEAAEDEDWRAAFPKARVRPVYHALRALAGLGREVRALPPARRGEAAALVGRRRALVANTGPEPAAIVLGELRPRRLRILAAPDLAAALADPDWLTRPGDPWAGDALTLPAYALASIELEEAG